VRRVVRRTVDEAESLHAEFHPESLGLDACLEHQRADFERLAREVAAWKSRKKTCSKCREPKDRDEFYHQSSSKDGLTSQCRSCINGS
jgi:hypothetical protein